MGDKILTFEDIEIGKNNFDRHKALIFLGDVDM